jgi:hypothetical protein
MTKIHMFTYELKMFVFEIYFSLYCHIIVVLRVHCDVYKSSYNISVEFTPPSFSFIPLPPHSWNSFIRSHFSIFMST